MSLAEVLPVTSVGFLTSLLKQDGLVKKEQANKVLFQRGENALGVFVVLSGTVELSLGNERSRQSINRTMGPGTILGLPAAVSEEPYSMTATTLESCELIFVRRETIVHLLSSDPQLAMPLLQTLAHEVHQLREMWTE
jgi:CRP-like cAMP-binding protein